MVINWIMNIVTNEIGDNMKFVDGVAFVWNKLTERFSSINGHHIYKIRKDMCVLTQENVMKMYIPI